MITIYHNLDFQAAHRLADPEMRLLYQPAPRELELVAIVHGEDDLNLALHRAVHDEGVAWTHAKNVTVLGDPRARRSTYDGDILVDSQGLAHLVLPNGFRPLPDLRLPYLQ